ncbi:MAG: hypothetical protein ACRD1C_10885 [Terriglobales bacterium]
MTVREQLEAGLSARGWGETLRQARAGGLRRRPREGEAGLVAGAMTELAAAPGGGAAGCAVRWAAASAGCIAWADPCDRFDPHSAHRVGVDLERLLWLRGSPALRGMEGLSRWNEILNLVIQSHTVELVVADFLDWPVAELRRIPRSAWFRLLRGLEYGRQTALLLLAPEPLSGTCSQRLRLGERGA